METAIVKTVGALAQYGGGFVVAAIFILLYVLDRRTHSKSIAEERARNDKLSEKLIELSNESIRADINHAKSIEMLEKTLDRRI